MFDSICEQRINLCCLMVYEQKNKFMMFDGM